MRYYSILILTTIICFGPSKMLPYTTPLLLILAILFNKNIYKEIYKNTILLLFIILFGCVYYLILFKDFIVYNYLFSIITYSSFLPIFIINRKYLANKYLYIKVINFITIFVVIEASIGIIQYIYKIVNDGWGVATGDSVEGTIDIYPAAGGGFNNPIFIISMIFLTSFLFAFKNYYKYHNSDIKILNIAIVLGTISIILGTVIHALLFFLISLITVKLFSIRGKIKKKIIKVKYLIVVLLIIIMTVNVSQYAMPHIALIKFYTEYLIKDYEKFPKSDITIKAFTSIPKEEPYMVVMGLGPGQFSSRASLILSGYYIGGKDYSSRSQLGKKSNPIMEKYLLPLIINPKTSLEGSTSKPYYSILSLFTELGIVGIFIFMFFLTIIFMRINKNKTIFHKKIKYMFLVQILFLLLLGIQENYWELTQAIYPGLLLMKLEYSSLN